MSLAVPRTVRRSELARFALLDGLPTLVRVLARHVGPARAARALLAFALRSPRDPLRDVPRTWVHDQERLTRDQLVPVLHLDDIARDVLDLPDEARMALLADLVAEGGQRFLAGSVPTVSRADWGAATAVERERFARGLVARFFNAKVELQGIDTAGLGADVTACRFVELCHAVGRPYLAPLFCEADSRYFERPDLPIKLARSGTIARGAARCDFRFRFEDRS